MADSNKNILITPATGTTSEPKIEFTGYDANTISLNVLDDGTLSIEGSAGQLFSVSDSLTGTIFSVNDISGIPSIEVIDDGTITLAEYSGNVGIGTSSPTSKLDVAGTVNATSFVKSGGTSSQFLKADGSIDSTTYLPASSYTASDVLTKIKTVDGSGSGLDADTLDGVQASGFAPASHTHPYLPLSGGTLTGDVTGTTFNASNFKPSNAVYFGGGNNYLNWTNNRIYSNVGIEANGGLYSNGSPVITTSNIGSQSVSYATTAGSASNIDGVAFRNGQSGSQTSPDNIVENGHSYINSVSLFGQTDGALYSQAYSSSWVHQIYGDYRTGNMAVRGKNNGTWTGWNTVWTSGNDGAGSGLDADTVDGIQGSSIVQTTAVQALHATDALRISGNRVYLYKGNGENEYVDIPSGLQDTAHNFASNGYQKLSNGLIIQWGYNNTTASGTRSQTFPIAFPNACLNVTCGSRRATGGGGYAVQLVGEASTTGFSFYMYYSGDMLRYIAIGY